MTFEVLMKHLAEEVGESGGFVADEDGVVRIGAAGGGAIAFMEVADIGSMLIWSRVGDADEEGQERLKNELLKANFMGRIANGGALSLSDDGGIYLHRLLPLDITDGDRFMEALTAFVETAVNWRQIIAAYVPAADAEPAASPAPGDARYLKV